MSNLVKINESTIDRLHPDAIGLKLFRHTARGHLIACELVIFTKGYDAVHTVLRRAQLSGTVKIEPFDEPMDYFADVFVTPNQWEQSILLDKNSYRTLKQRWMRCKLETDQ